MITFSIQFSSLYFFSLSTKIYVYINIYSLIIILPYSETRNNCVHIYNCMFTMNPHYSQASFESNYTLHLDHKHFNSSLDYISSLYHVLYHKKAPT